MPNKCSVVVCNSGYKDGPNYPRYKFPQDNELAGKWLQFLNRPTDYVVTDNTFICSIHFESIFLKATHYFTRLNNHLNPVPTIHLLSTPQSQGFVPTNSRPPPKKRVLQTDQIFTYEEKFRIQKFQDVIEFLEYSPKYSSLKLHIEDTFVTAYNLAISSSVADVKECITIYTDFQVKLSYEGSPIPLPSYILNSTDHKLTHLDALENLHNCCRNLTPSLILML